MLLAALLLLSSAPGATAPQAAIHSGRMTLRGVDSAPPRQSDIDDAAIAKLRAAVDDAPRDRDHRLALVRALVDAGRLEPALDAAQAWREVDAYNLVVVRLIGDILVELERPEDALRTYSAVTELLPDDPETQRALATVLKQQGDLEAARVRLLAARKLRPEDARLRFELADVALRLGRTDEALEHFEAIAAASDVPQALRHPARQRLGQVFASKRRAARATGDDATAKAFDEKIRALGLAGGTDNDIKVYLSWDTDRTDVDLWLTNPLGEKVFYSNRKGKLGGELFDDVTTGYGPESFTAAKAHAGTYSVTVDYFGTDRGSFKEARGEVIVVLNEGRDDEAQHTFAYRLYRPKQTVTVAKIEVKK